MRPQAPSYKLNPPPGFSQGSSPSRASAWRPPFLSTPRARHGTARRGGAHPGSGAAAGRRFSQRGTESPAPPARPAHARSPPPSPALPSLSAAVSPPPSGFSSSSSSRSGCLRSGDSRASEASTASSAAIFSRDSPAAGESKRVEAEGRAALPTRLLFGSGAVLRGRWAGRHSGGPARTAVGGGGLAQPTLPRAPRGSGSRGPGPCPARPAAGRGWGWGWGSGTPGVEQRGGLRLTRKSPAPDRGRARVTPEAPPPAPSSRGRPAQRGGGVRSRCPPRLRLRLLREGASQLAGCEVGPPLCPAAGEGKEGGEGKGAGRSWVGWGRPAGLSCGGPRGLTLYFTPGVANRRLPPLGSWRSSSSSCSRFNPPMLKAVLESRVFT